MTEHMQVDDEARLFEEAFLLMAQTSIQGMLNQKQLRYRDLSKRLGVSEARVSQMMGDDAVNLTIRTIARIYRTLGEEPVIMSRRDFERATRGIEQGSVPTDTAWTMVATEMKRFEVARVHIVEDADGTADRRPSRSSDWIEAGPALIARGG